jgi:drug/metabolite transporter (DMT)-like permease
MPELIGYILALDAIFTWAIASLVYKKGLEKTDPKRFIIAVGLIILGNYIILFL